MLNRAVIVAAIGLSACGRLDPDSSVPASPPPTYVVTEPEVRRASIDLRPRLHILLPSGIRVEIEAHPLTFVGGNWAFTVEMKIVNASGTTLERSSLDLFSTSLASCARASHWREELANGASLRGQRTVLRSLNPGSSAELDLYLCPVHEPGILVLDRPPLAKLRASVDATGQLSTFELVPLLDEDGAVVP
jgi:hypothetical protein